jgi:hypothetical protein
MKYEFLWFILPIKSAESSFLQNPVGFEKGSIHRKFPGVWGLGIIMIARIPSCLYNKEH